MQALVYLRTMMLRNMALSYLRRLRQPRYLLGTAMAGAYFWFAFLNRTERPLRVRGIQLPDDGFEMIFAFVLLGLLLVMWLREDDKPGLRFSEAETAFLFPAPLSRRQLLHYKLLTGLGASLLSALFFTLLMARGIDSPGGVMRSISSWWMFNANLSLHGIAVPLLLSRLARRGVELVQRRTLVALALALLVAGAVYLVRHEQFDLLRQMLTPARLLVRVFLATGVEYAQSFLLLIALLALQYWWVLRLETPFEEVSMALAVRQTALIARMRSGKSVFGAGKPKSRREPFGVQHWMPVELVLLWKNLLGLPKWLNVRVLAIGVVATVAGLQWMRYSGLKVEHEFMGIAALGVLIYAQVLGPLFVRFDLAEVELMKALPIPGWRIVLGNLLAPVLVMCAIGWWLLLIAALALPMPPGNTMWLAEPMRTAWLFGVALVLPALTALQLIGPNATGLFFPAWALTNRNVQRGFDVMGIRMVLGVGQLLLLILALLPPLFAAVVARYFSQWFTTAAGGVVAAAVTAFIVLLLEALFGVHLLGERYEQLDVAGELRQ
jgi:ABC-2 type transport system permease protein